MKTKKFEDFRHSGGVYTAVTPEEKRANLAPAMYTIKQDRNGNVFYCDCSLNHDSIIDIPSSEFEVIVNEITHFLKPSTEQVFRDFGFLYKRSALLYGSPGTGKTVIVNRVAREVIKNGGVVLFNPNPGKLTEIFEQLEDIQPNQKTMIIFEELDKLIDNYEGELLSLLDGEIQKTNIVYMATTNFIDKIPPRILRPGRFSTVIEIPFPNEESRRFFLNTKLPDQKAFVEEVVKKTKGFSIDELKEVVLATFCLNHKMDDVINRIRGIKELSNLDFDDSSARRRKRSHDFDLDDEDDFSIKSNDLSTAKNILT